MADDLTFGAFWASAGRGREQTMPIVHYYLGRPAHVWIAAVRRRAVRLSPAEPELADHPSDALPPEVTLKAYSRLLGEPIPDLL
jgi:hypothetical protein